MHFTLTSSVLANMRDRTGIVDYVGNVALCVSVLVPSHQVLVPSRLLIAAHYIYLHYITNAFDQSTFNNDDIPQTVKE